MHILVFSSFAILIFPEAVEQILEAHHDLVAMIQGDVGENRWVEGKEKDVDDQVARREICR